MKKEIEKNWGGNGGHDNIEDESWYKLLKQNLRKKNRTQKKEMNEYYKKNKAIKLRLERQKELKLKLEIREPMKWRNKERNWVQFGFFV